MPSPNNDQRDLASAPRQTVLLCLGNPNSGHLRKDRRKREWFCSGRSGDVQHALNDARGFLDELTSAPLSIPDLNTLLSADSDAPYQSDETADAFRTE